MLIFNIYIKIHKSNMIIKNFSDFKESLIIKVNDITHIFDINESLSLWYDTILQSIGAEEFNIYDTFNIPLEQYPKNSELDFYYNNGEFINSLSSIGLKRSNLENTDDYNTFTSNTCKFMLIYRIEANELENPEYIMVQVYNDISNKWDECKLYKIKDDIKKFYDKLSSKIIELELDNDRWIYNTSNGTEWILQNIDKENDDFKKYLRKDDMENLIKNKKAKLTII